MATVAERLRIRSLHHGTIPVVDVGRAYRFYRQVLNADLTRLINANVQALQRGFPEVAMMAAPGGLEFGLALQYAPPPQLDGFSQGVILGLDVTKNEAARIASELQMRGAAATSGVAVLPPECNVQCTLAFKDPDGNVWEVCTSGGSDKNSAMLRYVNLEAIDLKEAERFYVGELGLAIRAKTETLLVLDVGDMGQWLVIRRVAKMSPNNDLVKGPHIAFDIDSSTFDAVSKLLPNRELYWERTTTKVPWQEPWQRIIYFYDAFYNRLALVTP
jgi:catechol 2,3-dioxygenase-like lactoylglutathione lyase family enzyme